MERFIFSEAKIKEDCKRIDKAMKEIGLSLYNENRKCFALETILTQLNEKRLDGYDILPVIIALGEI